MLISHRGLMICATGELLVGALAALFPGPVMSFLLAAPVTGIGLFVARLAGIAIFALGVTWWKYARRHGQERVDECGAGFLVYNLGVGAVFLLYAWPGESWLWVPLAVAAAHLAAGLAYAIAPSRSNPSTR